MRFVEFKPVFFEEKFVRQRMKKGEVPFRQSSLEDPRIQKFLQALSQDTGVSYEDLEKEISKGIDKIQEIGKYSNLLHDTLIINAAENAAFDLIFNSKYKVSYENYKFDLRTFRKLLDIIQFYDHAEGLFPLREPGGINLIYQITPIFTPSTREEYKQYNSVTTAAITPEGKMIFNIPFMEKLLYYGAVTDVQPKGKKYVANGGDIPNNYCYIEFLIMHELLHYMHGDFISGKQLGQFSNKVHNWAGDFRSNYMLVKSGYEQLPIGLFSDDLNFDRRLTSNYKKLVTVVNQEMKKLPVNLRAWVMKKTEVDDHTPDPGEEEKQPWIPNVGDICLNNKQGTFVKITKVIGDGKFETEPASPEEVQERYPGVKVG